MHQGIDAGTIFDVSVGLFGGDHICDVCGEDLDEYDYDYEAHEYACPHVPMTTHAMTDDEIAAQTERGVPDGTASYTLVDAHCGETSAVYDGAVPGAGFRKFLRLNRAQKLSPDVAAQARHAYQLSKGDISMDVNDIVNAIKEGFSGLAGRPSEARLSNAPAAPPVVPAAPAAPDPAIAAQLTATQAENARLAAQVEQLRVDRETDRHAAQFVADSAWIDSKVKSFYVTPAAADKLRALARQHPDAFAALKPAIEDNGVIVALQGGVSAAELAANTASGREEGDTLITLAKKRASETGESYVEAFRAICIERPEVSSAYLAAQQQEGR
jgi:hypothetical protein